MRTRRLIATFLISLIVLLCFADTPETFINQLSHCMIVDLESTEYHTHLSTAGWTGGSGTSEHDTEDYYENQILTVIGLTGLDSISSDQDVTLTVSFGSADNPWCYILDSNDYRFMRPFGIDAFARGSTSEPGEYASGQDIPGYSLSLGKQANSTSTSNTITLEGDTIIDAGYQSVWWDICLVLDVDESLDNDIDSDDGSCVFESTTYYLSPSDLLYTSILDVNIKINESGSTTEYVVDEDYIIYLSGYYQSSETYDSDVTCNLYIAPLAAATAIDIETLLTEGVNTRIDVFDYNFATSTQLSHLTDDAPTGTVMLYLSSTSAATENGEEFMLRHVNTNGSVSSNDTNYNAVKYYAYLVSEKGFLYSDYDPDDTSATAGVTIQYDGTDYYGGSKDNYLVIPPNHSTSHNRRTTQWVDEGTVQVAIPSGQTIGGSEVTTETLISGQYVSNIYVNIVTDI